MFGQLPFRHLLLFPLGLVVGCASLNYQYTGQTSIYPIRVPENLKPASRSISDFGTPGAAFIEDPNRNPEEARYFRDVAFDEPGSRTLTISINRCYVKYLADPSKNKEVLAFVTVTDHADNSVYKRVFFDNEFAVEGAYLNFAGKTVYGPRSYHGRPITIDFYIAEVDQKENEVTIEAIRQVKQTLQLLGPRVTLASNLVTDIAQSLIRTNIDDRELQFSYELKPITYEDPTGADIRMSGNLLRTGNYVVVKQEFRRSDADWASIMPFEDELSYPYWLGKPVNATSGEFPNVVYLGGQLYVSRAFETKLQGLGGDWFSGFGSVAIRRRLWGVSWWFSSPQQKTENIRRAIRDLHRELMAESRMPTTRNKLAPSSGDYLFENVIFTPIDLDTGEQFQGADDFGDPGNLGLRERPVSPRKSEIDIQDFVLANYTPYKSKSYLSFTIRDDLSPADAAVLSALEEAGARRISEVVFTLSTDEQKAILGAIGGAVRTAVVRAIVRNQLKSAKSKQEMAQIEAELKKRFGEAYHGEIAMETSYRASMIGRLERKTGIKDLLGLTAKDQAISQIKAVLPGLRQDLPALARFGELFLRDLTEPEKPEQIPQSGESEDETDTQPDGQRDPGETDVSSDANTPDTDSEPDGR